ncbi:hypothetical protein BDW66DRAFT_145181, partial [Aspergillus desertorum]
MASASALQSAKGLATFATDTAWTAGARHFATTGTVGTCTFVNALTGDLLPLPTVLEVRAGSNRLLPLVPIVLYFEHIANIVPWKPGYCWHDELGKSEGRQQQAAALQQVALCFEYVLQKWAGQPTYSSTYYTTEPDAQTLIVGVLPFALTARLSRTSPRDHACTRVNIKKRALPNLP